LKRGFAIKNRTVAQKHPQQRIELDGQLWQGSSGLRHDARDEVRQLVDRP